MEIRHSLSIATGIAAMSTALMGSPAQADSIGLFNVAVGNCGVWQRQYCTGYGQGAPIGLSSLSVTISCSANSPFVVDRTGVGCYLEGINDGKQYLHTGPLFTPGASSAAANVGTVPFQGYRLCVGAGYSTAAGGYSPVSGFVCM